MLTRTGGWIDPIPWLPKRNVTSRKTDPKAQAGIAMLMVLLTSFSYLLVLGSGNSNMLCAAFYFIMIGIVLMIVNMLHLRYYTNLIILIIFSITVFTILAIYLMDLMPIIGTVILVYSVLLAVIAAYIFHFLGTKKKKDHHHRHDGLKEPEDKE